MAARATIVLPFLAQLEYEQLITGHGQTIIVGLRGIATGTGVGGKDTVVETLDWQVNHGYVRRCGLRVAPERGINYPTGSYRITRKGHDVLTGRVSRSDNRLDIGDTLATLPIVPPADALAHPWIGPIGRLIYGMVADEWLDTAALSALLRQPVDVVDGIATRMRDVGLLQRSSLGWMRAFGVEGQLLRRAAEELGCEGMLRWRRKTYDLETRCWRRRYAAVRGWFHNRAGKKIWMVTDAYRAIEADRRWAAELEDEMALQWESAAYA
jgi:hypothetical protein